MTAAPPKLVPFEAATPSIMGILDDAIREHLDLKRKHGARDSELREIEDEALGAGEQPEPFAAGELFNEPSAAEAPPTEEPTRLIQADSPAAGEPEPGGAGDADAGPADEPSSPPEGLPQVPGQEQFEEPIPGQQRLDEPQGGDAAPADAGPSLPEVEPPAPSESLEELIGEEEPFPEDAAAPPPVEETAPPPPVEDTAPPPPAPPPAPVEEAPVEETSAEETPPEPESAVPDPPPPPPDRGPEPPGRARGRVEVPTQEHPPPGETGGLPPLPEYEDEHDLAAPADEAPPVVEPPSSEEPLPPEDSGSRPELYDFETDEDSLDSPPVVSGDTDDDFEALGPETDERPYVAPETDESPYVPEEERPREELPPSTEAALEDDDVYEGDSPEAEESYEQGSDTDDDLWFEKGPPKDFDFDDD
jgi:hypothetical protein